MTVRPFQLDDLPRFSAAAVDAARVAAGRLDGIGSHVAEVRLAPLGAVSLRCVNASSPEPPGPGDAVWALCRGDGDPRQGYLVLDGWTALRIVALTLGLPTPRMLRALGAAERGIVAAAMATILRATAADAVVALQPKPWRADGLARLIIQASFGAVREHIRLDVPPGWIPSRPGPRLLLEDMKRAGLEIPLTVELARTTLTAGDWARARPGDAIVFDDRPALAPDRGWPARILCGTFAARAVIEDGCVRLLAAFHTDDSGNAHEISRTGRQTMSSDEQQAATSVTMLASAPIEVVAEIGRMVLRAEEIVALRPGSVLTLGPVRPTTVELRVGDRRWGNGELVNVDGQLGVRLTTLTSDSWARTGPDDDPTLR